jgi:hypothetical protein
MSGDPTMWPMPLDPLSLTRMGFATWMTELVVAQKWSEALWRQSALMLDGVRATDGVGSTRSATARPADGR